VNRIGGQTGGIIGVRIATGNREHALRQQRFQRMIDFTGLPLILKTGSQASGQSVLPVGRLQQLVSSQSPAPIQMAISEFMINETWLQFVSA